jgi:hypothetical protein
MKHRLLASLAVAALATALAAATAAGGGNGKLYQFRGIVLGAGSTSVQVQVEGGNRAALRALLGQSQAETFTLGARTQVLVWRNGIPRVGTAADVHPGDWVTVNVHAKHAASLAEILAHPAGRIADRAAKPAPPKSPLYLYVGTVAGPQSGGHIALHVTGGNKRALRSLLGQPADQSFAYGADTFFLLWQGRVPSVIDASQLKAGDRITIRIRAPKGSTLAQVEATPANRVGDHEPGHPTADNS